MSEIPKFEHNSLDEKKSHKLHEALNHLKNEGFVFDVEEDANNVRVHIAGDAEKGIEEKTFGFTKMGGEVLVAGFSDTVHLSDVIEARLRFPNDSVSRAVEKLKEFRAGEKK
jgi:hypothetical protein